MERWKVGQMDGLIHGQIDRHLHTSSDTQVDTEIAICIYPYNKMRMNTHKGQNLFSTQVMSLY